MLASAGITLILCPGRAESPVHGRCNLPPWHVPGVATALASAGRVPIWLVLLTGIAAVFACWSAAEYSRSSLKPSLAARPSSLAVVGPVLPLGARCFRRAPVDRRARCCSGASLVLPRRGVTVCVHPPLAVILVATARQPCTGRPPSPPEGSRPGCLLLVLPFRAYRNPHVHRRVDRPAKLVLSTFSSLSGYLLQAAALC